ncbi:hypothetical protein B0O99DRAFT_607672 [Bisporella sp. PMI_857]|nr:hypothetical protein B0O99DRAFT_607672 [Bisporella sp. PMI_857]
MKAFQIFAYLSFLFQVSFAQEACFRAKPSQTTPQQSSCAAPDLWALRDALCSSEENWGEGHEFLSGYGLNLRQRDNCTADGFPAGSYIYIALTISSTVKDREDCFNRTKHIIERCVENGYPTYNGGQWYDLEEPDKTFIYMEYLYTDPTPPPCYPPYCPSDEETASNAKKSRRSRSGREIGGTYIEMNADGEVLKKWV